VTDRVSPLVRSGTTRRATLAVGVAALVGVTALDWAPQRVLFVYWVDAGLVAVLSATLTLCAGRPPRTEGRTIQPPMLPAPGISDAAEWRLTRRLPPIRGRNVPYALGALLAGLVVWQTAVALVTIYLPSPEALRIAEHSLPVSQALSLTAAAYSPLGLGAGVALFGLRVAAARRALAAGRHETRSAPETAERLLRECGVWFALAVTATVVFPFVTLPLLAVTGTRTVTAVGLTAVVVAAASLLEFAATRPGAVGRLGRWLSVERSETGPEE